ncbi:dTMP kinase [Enterobacteriaceae endosymbiont of Macroplea appendiculata]|uniref:dTMP kinase n=1 Tax=Enterobacteriaceae endosymbiont of Macroplea appendiculata TaxID=2675790 RepID=UPI001449C6D3|nr:dTMP kinase [Enterobacteriaceae endosymbiont of Macroplea appendiculata]QJC30710.1 dTMP kinase [Enterobacteriaceae endosymbiont of Macroplea appendiculata]
MKKNQFIVVEGINGSGKSTICHYIKSLLNTMHIYNIIFTHEPGGTYIAEKIRHIIKYNKNEYISKKTELLLIYAARSQLLNNIIKPNFNKTWIISDRYDLSSYAYQIGGRGISINNILFLQNFIKNNIIPHIIIYLDVNPVISLQRIQHRTKDRIETESIKFFTNVRKYYLKMAQQNTNIKVINANHTLLYVKHIVKKKLFNFLYFDK